MTTHDRSLRTALLAGSMLAAWPVLAADVTPERLLNPEPQNWLMNHRTYDGQRFSPLDTINKTNVKGLKLAYAVALGGGAGNYSLQAAIVACRARARTAADTDWERIVLLYDALLQIGPSPIVGLNRAVAVGMAQGPAAGLAALDDLNSGSTLAGYHLLPSVRGDLLLKLGRFTEAREELQRAMAMTENRRVQDLLSEKLKQIPKIEQDA